MLHYKITPEYLTKYVNFNASDKNWYYSNNNSSNIPDIQAEGAAKAWNLLIEQNIALLADEVGMGKTIEALAVMVTLWRQKPNAKVLLYAPNENVAKKWIIEYENFIRYHYRINDNVNKSSINNEALRTAQYCENHIEFMRLADKKFYSLFICKTSSLSGFQSPKINNEFLNEIHLAINRNLYDEKSEEEQTKWMINFSISSNEYFYNTFSENNNPPFDLLIFDEAHYLRRTEGAFSNKSIAAHGLFSGRNIGNENEKNNCKPLAKMALLLTATPNHSSSLDIQNIVGLFNPKFKSIPPKEILEKICIRRYRRLAGKTKHEYRDEIPAPVELISLDEKLFFALYQKCLVYQKSKVETDKKQHNRYSILFGYLEGFEFLPNTHSKYSIKESNESETSTDFHKTEDSKIIMDLSSIYIDVYKKPPKHPKYDKIIEELSPKFENLLPEKKLIFVRRIPSVYEITARLINEYDNLFVEILKNVIPKNIRKKHNKLRDYFWKLGKRNSENTFELNKKEDESLSENSLVEIPYSKVYDLFTIKKTGKFKSTDCSNFRLRFQRKENIFSIFFEPAKDYKSKPYTLVEIFEKENIKIYKNSVYHERYNNDDNFAQSFDYIIFDNENLNKVTGYQNKEFQTLLSIWYQKNDYKSEKTLTLVEKAKNELSTFNLIEKEAFSSYLEKGVLFSSIYIIYFYSIYKSLQKKGFKSETLYQKFCDKIEIDLEDIKLVDLIATAILTFKNIYKKMLGLTENNLLKEEWRFLNNTHPVYPYCGETKRESIIHAFNTPFFPNYLIATSVLQEGVDLHYNCSEVIHYGIAWTQGDNEQRVGRVDRLFGKLENNLKVNSDTTLPIKYPYLKNTIDEEQVSRFIKRKKDAETLIDRLIDIEQRKEINPLYTKDENWTELFNKPKALTELNEPFGVKKDDFISISSKDEIFNNMPNLLNSIFGTLKKYFDNEFIIFETKIQNSICGIKHILSNKRHQPVLFEIKYIEEGLFYLNKPVYCLIIKTPIYRKNINFNDLRIFGSCRDIYYSNPILKICTDLSLKSNNRFRKYISAELPLFITKNEQCNISEDELICAVNLLISFTDELEIKHNAGDIKNEEIISSVQSKTENEESLLTQNRVNNWQNGNWKYNENYLDYIYKSIDNLSKECLDNTYEFNHKNNFVRKISNSTETLIQTALYKYDALDEEIMFLEKIIGKFN